MAEARFPARPHCRLTATLRVGSLLSSTLQMEKLRPGKVFESSQMVSGWAGTPCWVVAPEPPAQERQPGAGCACAFLDNWTAGDRQEDKLS